MAFANLLLNVQILVEGSKKNVEAMCRMVFKYHLCYFTAV